MKELSTVSVSEVSDNSPTIFSHIEHCNDPSTSNITALTPVIAAEVRILHDAPWNFMDISPTCHTHTHTQPFFLQPDALPAAQPTASKH